MTKRNFLSAFSVCNLIILLCLCVSSGTPAFAIDGDASNPIALSSNEVSGKEEPKGQSRFYSFAAGPGDINIKVNGATDFYSTTMRIVLRDTNSRELANISFPAISDESTKTATVHLAAKQNLIMQVMFAVDVGVHVNYKVQLDGSAFSQNGMLASAPPSVSSRSTGSTPPVASTPSVPARQRSAPAAPPVVAPAPQIASAAREAFVTTSDSKTTTVQIKDTPVKADDSVNKPIDDKWALIVGISKFQKPEVNLKYPAKDASDLRDFLVKEANFAPDHVKLLVDENATKVNVMAEIGDKWLPRVAHPNDLVLIYISTHGSPSNVDLQGLNYLVMHDTDPSSLYATGLPLQDLAAAIKQRVHANRVVLVVDACHSGAANPAKGLTRIGNFDSDSLLLGTGQLIICSSEPSQVSWESKRYENGVFTHNLIQALRDKGGKVPLGEAFEKLKDSVVSEVLKDRGELQSPVMKTHWSGKDLILSAPPARPH